VVSPATPLSFTSSYSVLFCLLSIKDTHEGLNLSYLPPHPATRSRRLSSSLLHISQIDFLQHLPKCRQLPPQLLLESLSRAVLFSLLLARLTNSSKFSDASYSRSCISATAMRSRMSSTRNIDLLDSFCSTSALIFSATSKSTALSCKVRWLKLASRAVFVASLLETTPAVVSLTLLDSCSSSVRESVTIFLRVSFVQKTLYYAKILSSKSQSCSA